MKLLKKHALSFLCSVCIMAMVWSYRAYMGKYSLANENPASKTQLHILADEQKDCFKSWAFEKYSNFQKTFKDVQHAAEEIIGPTNGKNIFFHQTDCIHDGILRLSARQACAVESAALTNPEQTVYLLYVSPVGFLNSTPLPFIDAIKSYPNVHIFNNDMETAVRWTPAAGFLTDTSTIYLTDFVQFHITDILKFATLWKYGGTAMDLDVIVQKDLLPLEGNYAGAGSDESLMYFHVLNLGLSDTGKHISNTSLDEIQNNFDASDRDFAGQTILNTVVRNLCGNKTRTSEMTKDNCKGFRVLPKEEFYAYDWENWEMAYAESELSTFIKTVGDASVVHFTNQLSKHVNVSKSSTVGYNVLAKKFCPKVYAAITEETF